MKIGGWGSRRFPSSLLINEAPADVTSSAKQRSAWELKSRDLLYSHFSQPTRPLYLRFAAAKESERDREGSWNGVGATIYRLHPACKLSAAEQDTWLHCLPASSQLSSVHVSSPFVDLVSNSLSSVAQKLKGPWGDGHGPNAAAGAAEGLKRQRLRSRITKNCLTPLGFCPDEYTRLSEDIRCIIIYISPRPRCELSVTQNRIE